MEARRIIGGIEGGATHSTVVLLDPSGEVIAKAKGPGTNHFLLGMPECQKRIAGMVNDVKNEAGIPEDVPLEALGLSLSGCEHDDLNKQLVNGLLENYPNLSEQYVIGSDTEGSVATTSNEGGITCISGTGSNTLLINSDGSRVQCGGWGYLIGDEGSGYYIAKTAIKTCFDADEGFRTPPYPTDGVWALIKRHFKIRVKFDLLEHLYSNFDKAFIASLCKSLASLARDGDPLARSIFAEAGADLARALGAVVPRASPQLAEREGGVHVLCVGSVWLSWDLLEEGFVDYIENRTNIRELSLMKLTTTMAVGAAYMAADRLGLELKRNYEGNYAVFYTYRRGG